MNENSHSKIRKNEIFFTTTSPPRSKDVVELQEGENMLFSVSIPAANGW